jgi:hypothetical protein
MKASILVTLSTLVAYAFAANVADRPHLSGKTLNVTANSFCLFMPKTPGETIAASEATAIAFCNNTASAPGAKALPKGFIKSTHFLSGKGEGKYVQYTGSIDNSKYSLDPKDGGGQYDDHVSSTFYLFSQFEAWKNLLTHSSFIIYRVMESLSTAAV